MTKDQVQHMLNNIGYNNEFTVVFIKKDGTQRKITGMMETPTKEPNGVSVSVMVTEGEAAGQWRGFRLDSVLSIMGK